MSDVNVNFPPTPSPNRSLTAEDVDAAVMQVKADVEGQVSEVAEQLKGTGKKTEGTITMAEFPLIPPEVDDTARIKRAMLYLRDNANVSRLTFQQKAYTFSDSFTGDISLTDKTIDGYGSLFIDKRQANKKPFMFNSCARVTLQNFMFTSAYDYSIVSNTIKDLGALIIFDKQNDAIKIKNIDMTNIFGTGIWIAPRTDKPCTNIEIENITSNHLRKSTLYLSSIVGGTGYTPSEIKNITVKNLTSKYCGAYYDVNGVSTRAPEVHWTAGVDFGEELSLLENATFSNCHVSYASESGFHCEGAVACVNVQFHNCSSRFNGARSGAQYGYGWFLPKGVSLVKCITQGNLSPYRFNPSTANMPYTPGDSYSVDIYDKDFGKIFDDGQKVLTFGQSNEINLLSQDGDKKTFNYMDATTEKMPFGHSHFTKLNPSETEYKYYLNETLFTDLIKFERASLYKINLRYKKTDITSNDISYILRGEKFSLGGQEFVYTKNDKDSAKLNKILATARTFKIVNPNTDLLAMRISTLNQIFEAKIKKLIPKVNINLLDNPSFNETEPCDWRFYSQNFPGSKFLDNPDATLAYKLFEDAEGKWISTNNSLVEVYAWWKRVYSHDLPILRHQKLSVTIAYKSDAAIDNVADYLQLRLNIYGEDNTLKGYKDQDIKDVTTTTKAATFVIDATNLITTDKGYFNASALVVTNKTYDVLTPIKFKILDMHLTY